MSHNSPLKTKIPDYRKWIETLTLLSLDQQLIELDEIKKLVTGDPPHNYMVFGAIKAIFGHRIQTILNPDCPGNYFRNLCRVLDTNRMEIHLDEHVVDICAGRNGDVDGKIDDSYEVRCCTKKDEHGNIDYSTSYGYVHDFTFFDEFYSDKYFHGKASDDSTWGFPPLRLLRENGVADLVKVFCKEMNEWN